MADVGEEDKFSSQSDRGGLEADVQGIQSYFEKSRSVNLHIAVIGESGTGKSTFINGLLGIGDGDDGKTETTLEPIMWKHPNKDTVKICELPGTGDRKFLASVYLDRVKFDQYDFFIILNNTHFKQNDVNLAKEIHQRKKTCYFVRSKIDQELESVKGREKSKYNEGETLDRLRNDCVESLRKEGIKSPQVFLISSWYLDTFDFGKLQEVVGRDLPDLKRRLFLLSLPNITSSIIEKKKEAMMDEIGKVAVLSAASVPIPGLTINCDIPLLVTNLSSYRTDLGLDNDSLGRLAKSVGKRMEELKSEVKSQFGVEVRDEVVRKVLIETGKEEENVRRRFAQYLASAAPDIDPTSSYTNTCNVLETAVQEMVEDSKRVLRKGFQEFKKIQKYDLGISSPVQIAITVWNVNLRDEKLKKFQRYIKEQQRDVTTTPISMRKFLERKVDELREEMRNEVRGSEMEMDRATEELEKCLRNELEEFCGNYDLNFKECAMKTPVNSVRKRLQGTAGDLVEETWRELIPSNEERDSVPRELDRDLRREPEGFRENDRPGSKTFSRRFLVGMSIGALIVGFVLGVVLWATVPNPRFACSNPTGVRKENVTAYPSGNAPPGGGAGVRDWDGVDVPPTIPLIETPNRAKRSQDHEAPPGGRAGVRPGSKTYSRRFLVGMPIGALIVGFVLGVVLWATAPNPRFACSNPTGASLDTGLGLEWVGVGKEKATSHPSGNAPPGGGAGVRDWDGVDVPPTIPPIQTQNRAKRSQDHEAPPGGGAGVRDWDGVDVPPDHPPDTDTEPC